MASPPRPASGPVTSVVEEDDDGASAPLTDVDGFSGSLTLTASLSLIVAVPWGLASVASSAAGRVSVNASVLSCSASSAVGTVTSLTVSPGGKLSVPVRVALSGPARGGAAAGAAVTGGGGGGA